MASLLERKLLVVTGKGGTGKTTVACALGLIAAARGSRTLVVELGGQQRLPELFAGGGGSHGDAGGDASPGRSPAARGSLAAEEPVASSLGEELALKENLWCTSIDSDRAMIDWLRALTGRVSAHVLASSSTFRYFAAAAPGAKELVTMVKVFDLVDHYDLVVLDAPATGHALSMLRSPQTFSAIARVGPLASQSRRVRKLLEDPARCGYVAVAQGSELAVTETLELEEGLRRLLDRDLDAVFVNGTVPRRFTREELTMLEAVDGEDAVVRSAVRMARAVHERARVQQSQIARLRRQRFSGGEPPGVLTVPFEFVAELDLEAIRHIAERLARKI